MTTPVLDPTQTQVGTANGPGIWIAPAGTPPPAAGGAFASPWASLGYASDDGPTIGQDTDSEDLTPWQSVAPIRTVITGKSITLHFVLWQLNEQTLALYFDTAVTAPVTGKLAMDVPSTGGGHIYAVAIDSLDGVNAFRVTFPRATLESAGDMQLQKGAMVPIDVTLKALDNAGILAHIDLASPNLKSVEGEGVDTDETMVGTPAPHDDGDDGDDTESAA
jgi:hypothetical protein